MEQRGVKLHEGSPAHLDVPGFRFVSHCGGSAGASQEVF